MSNASVAGSDASAAHESLFETASDAGSDESATQESLFDIAVAATEYPRDVLLVMACVEKALHCIRGGRLFAYGSSANGFGDRASDVDLVLQASRRSLLDGLKLGTCPPEDLARCTLVALRDHLRSVGIRVREQILHARVPVLKLIVKVDGQRNVDCDLSINNLLPVFNTRLVRSYANADSRAIGITQQVKQWAKRAWCSWRSSWSPLIVCIYTDGYILYANQKSSSLSARLPVARACLVCSKFEAM